uniref:Uncharacterized protein n=1 Tax=Oryza brachyantha TaxID=4533 RepID=J3LBV7_ORYBR
MGRTYTNDEEIVISSIGNHIYVFCLMSHCLCDFWICEPLSTFCFILYYLVGYLILHYYVLLFRPGRILCINLLGCYCL